MSARAGKLDWLACWQDMQVTSAAMLGEAERGEGVDRWRHRAARFDRVSRGRADAAVELLGSAISPTDIVADLGAGTGRHAIPLARRCKELLAVEPSAAMRGCLEARVAEEHVANITVVAEAWPCSLPVVDVAFASHVLYGVADVARFVGEMTRATRRTCFLVMGLRAPADGVAPLWQALHGRARPPRPAALEAFAVLHQLGYPASLRIVSGSERPLAFSPTEEELTELCHRVSVPADEAGRRRVATALDRLHPRPSPTAPWALGTLGPNALIEWPGGAS